MFEKLDLFPISKMFCFLVFRIQYFGQSPKTQLFHHENVVMQNLQKFNLS
jgi:hypothetical protein